MASLSSHWAVLVLAVATASCTRHHEPPPAALPTGAAGPAICGELIPRAVAETMAGTDKLIVSGTLETAHVRFCTVFRGVGKKEQVFHIRESVSADHAADSAYRELGRPIPRGVRLPPSEGYGAVQPGGDGTKGRNASAASASGTVLIFVNVMHDARGRDPVADARALLNLLGPKLAPEWPKPPPGLDPLNPTSPPPGTRPFPG